VRDLSDRHEAEKKIRNSESRLRDIIDSMPGAVLVFDAQECLELWNQGAGSALTGQLLLEKGLSANELARRIVSYFDTPDAPTWAQDRVLEFRAGSKFTAKARDGRTFLVTYQKVPNHGTITLALDITEQQTIEDKLRASEQELRAHQFRLREIIDGLPVVVLVWNAQERLELFNELVVRNSALRNAFQADVPYTAATAMVGSPLIVQSGDSTKWIQDQVDRFRRLESSKFRNLDGRMFEIHHRRMADGGTLSVGVDITDAEEMTGQLQASERNLRELSQWQTDIFEAERRRVAMELHDQVGNLVSALAINVSTAQQGLGTLSLSQTHARLSVCLQLAQDATSAVRSVMGELRASELEELGLAAALRSYCRRFQFQTGIRTTLNMSAAPMPRRSQAVEIAVYRIVQEALGNVFKHAAASAVRVAMETSEASLSVSIEDNGIGFNPAAVRTQPGNRKMGIHFMRERALAIGASFTIQSAPSQGTNLVVNLPG